MKVEDRAGIVNSYQSVSLRAKVLIVLLGIALTGILATAVTHLVPARYVSSATVLVYPSGKSIPKGGNPFLFLGGVAYARDVLLKVVNADSTRADLLSARSNADYEATLDVTSSAPMIMVTATAGTPAASLSLLNAVIDQLPAELQESQDEADTPPESRLETVVLVRDTDTRTVTKSQTRALLAAIALGVGGTFTALAGAEAWNRRRAARRSVDRIRPTGDTPTHRSSQAETAEPSRSEFSTSQMGTHEDSAVVSGSSPFVN